MLNLPVQLSKIALEFHPENFSPSQFVHDAGSAGANIVGTGVSKLIGGMSDGFSNALNPHVAVPIGNTIASGINNYIKPAVNYVENNAGSWGPMVGGGLGLAAAFGLMNSFGGKQQPQGYPYPPMGYGGGPQSNYINPNYINPNEIRAGFSAPLNGFKMASIKSKLIGAAADRLITKDAPSQPVESKEDRITGKNEDTKELLKDPKAKDYVQNLLEN